MMICAEDLPDRNVLVPLVWILGVPAYSIGIVKPHFVTSTGYLEVALPRGMI